MSLLIEKHGGTLDKFMGDGIMVFYGAPDEMNLKEQAERAVATAIAMQKMLKELGEKWIDEGLDHNIKMRVGIHQDYVTVGNFGSENLMEYTSIGGGVNLASRLENMCTSGKVQVSFSVYPHTRDHYKYEELREMQLKGFVRPLRVSELDPAHN